jgi:hypothetical protein
MTKQKRQVRALGQSQFFESQATAVNVGKGGQLQLRGKRGHKRIFADDAHVDQNGAQTAAVLNLKFKSPINIGSAYTIMLD